jgi:oxygen-dependent protoporphyrinogen oxidase
MENAAGAPPDLAVIGAGISGLSLAWKAASEGRCVLLLEKENRAGGCIHSERPASLPGFWFELGAHTTYNSYGSFLDVVEGAGLITQLLPRGPARAKFGFLVEGETKWLSPPKVLFELSWWEALLHAPLGIFKSKHGRTMREHFGGLVGPKNYARVLSPFLSAVPSQSADEFPAEGPGALFKTRPRRKDVLRSFGFEGGLQRVLDEALKHPHIRFESGASVRSIQPSDNGFRITRDDGTVIETRLAAVATPLTVAKTLLSAHPDLAKAVSAIETVSIESLGIVLPREQCWMPECAFVVPANDSFFSCVTRDPFPDANYRAFAFHFRAGLTREERILRACEVLRVGESDFLHLAEKSVTLPSPKRDHAAHVAAIDAALGGTKLALTGNYFNGLAIEDCVLRSNAEWARIR